MKFNVVKCWRLTTAVCDFDQIATQEPELQLVKKSILKNAYRAFCLNSREKIETSKWYKNFLEGDKILFYLDGSGLYKLANLDLVESEFYFEKHNQPVGYRPWIFFSWQSDYNPSRSQIKEIITETLEEINQNRRPKSSLELVESTRQEDGAEDITKAIKQNLDRCLIAIFDITNVADVATNENNAVKSYPNANVIFELSYALQRKQHNQIIIVKQERKDIATTDVPFDFRQYRHIAYTTPKQLKSHLKLTIIQTLEKMGYLR
jgi:Predicted nucleotide-binding protein containing TIR-like domain